MAELEELKKKLVPLFDAEKGFSSGSTLDPSDSYMVNYNPLLLYFSVQNFAENVWFSVNFYFFLLIYWNQLSDGGTVNLLSKSYNVYNINELGLQKCSSSSPFSEDDTEKTYRCASHEIRIFGSIGSGASSVVQRAIHIPNHRIIAVKKINIFEKVCILCINTCSIHSLHGVVKVFLLC